ncbi:Crp/Fnr family transcriptional regulator [Sphingomonas oryzagri]
MRVEDGVVAAKEMRAGHDARAAGRDPSPGPAAFRISSHRYVSFVAQSQLVTSDLSAQERGDLEMAVSPARSAAVGDALVDEGQKSGELHILLEGWACRYKSFPDGRRQVTGLLLAGDVCNLDALFFETPDYGVRMLTEGTLFSLPRARAETLARRHPGISRTFTRLSLVENSVVRQWILNLGRRGACVHLAHLFCELDARLAPEEHPNTPRELPLGRELLADLVGLSPVHVSRAIAQLRSDGLVANDRGKIRLIDVERLRRLGDFDPAYLHDSRGG